jgi:uncharacterized protein YeaC (DUF1315 family)
MKTTTPAKPLPEAGKWPNGWPLQHQQLR